ncbi:hypothetical protein SAMN05421809_3685 [Natronorubrum daqingense]|uniref:Uncharacterized protein n=1 Tax=Natronorubrum daqingense TaxID=588898 RepID=A0A1N7G2K6_9EURY|nr:hypothetical protein BB347_18335 [Natronorubrum daqingense]SIS06666.1 hypothetical protein SAMN05421809_3685 [Natronorubrum daqingense]
MNAMAGILLFIVGFVGFLWPEKTLRFWFLGMLKDDSLLGTGRIFFRGLGALCMIIGIVIAVSG